MGEKRLINDTARETAKKIVQVFAPLLRDEELRDAFEEVLIHTTAGLERFTALSERERLRLHDGT
ncbi:hypothetical protein GobsT_26050 [Gemmata obscuriglobus]|uniref:Uncharacterized protein n=1 Tax=Gemmata obscuriglobus TaxID=114 RepID=A0A2Z3H6B9_9BACT|nr:hypothetical protein [Gemmata obscuriglobus]AWM39116.1 hypothetical protein C1280_20430 [Gemmata obscuriglobus]QEG27841.1 hypothetical protein GobsT_26050 [Gemmata obscuriglobus]VTS05208.1 unnamed protein product [Gemmata obscuriglobus UQM 2246]